MKELPPEAEEGDPPDAASLIEALPLGGFARRQAQAMEARVLATLKRKLDGLDLPADSARAPASESVPAPDAGARERDPGEVFAQLLERSLEQREETAERDLLLRTVDQLTCDEARIIAALSDGRAAPACQVGAASRIGLAALPVLRHASRVGVEAGVMLRAQVPSYLAHLLALGVIETAPEDRGQGDAYAMLLSDETVRETVTYIEQTLKLQARISRYSLRLSALGRQLWACSDAARR